MPSVGSSTPSSASGGGGRNYYNIRGTFENQPVLAGTATLSNVTASVSSVTIIAANESRKGVVVFNDSSSDMYLKFGDTASTSSFTVKVSSNTLYEMPGPHLYSGVIDGIWDTATGTARVTELT